MYNILLKGWKALCLGQAIKSSLNDCAERKKKDFVGSD